MKHDDRLNVKCSLSCCDRPLPVDDVSTICDIDIDLPEAMKLRARGMASLSQYK